MRTNSLTTLIAIVLVGAAVGVASLVAFTGRSHEQGSDQPAATHQAGTKHAHHTAAADDKKVAAQGRVEIVQPGAVRSVGTKFTVKVKLHDFTIDPKAVGGAPRPGFGHLHFQLDGGKYDFARYSGPNGEIAQKAGVAGKFSPSLATQVTYSHIPKGKHTVTVYLAHNNHVETGAKDTLDFFVR